MEFSPLRELQIVLSEEKGVKGGMQLQFSVINFPAARCATRDDAPRMSIRGLWLFRCHCLVVISGDDSLTVSRQLKVSQAV